MSSFIQLVKMFISGSEEKGIRFRTRFSIFLAIAVIIIEIIVYCVYWDSIPDMVKYDYDLSGISHNICEKEWIWVNLLLQMLICAFVFVVKKLAYRLNRVRSIVYDGNNNLVPILDRRISMFAWETAMLFVTTEQGYIFALVDIVKDRMCDDIVTVVFLFWFLVLLVEFRSDLKTLRSRVANDKDSKQEA